MNSFRYNSRGQFGAPRFGDVSASTAVGSPFSDQLYSSAVSQGQWLAFPRGDVIAPDDSRLQRNSDGTWTIHYSSGAANVGYIATLHPPIQNGVAGAVDGVLDFITNAASDIGNALAAAENSVASDFASIESALNDVESFISSLPNEIVSVWKDFLNILTGLVNDLGADLDGMQELGNFIISISSHLVSILDPSGTAASRQVALQALNPLNKTSPVYAFITSSEYAKARKIMGLLIMVPIGLTAFGVFELLFAAVQGDVLSKYVSPEFAQIMSPGNSVDTIMSMLSAIVYGLANGQNAFQIIESTINAAMSFYGIECSPACLVRLVYKTVSGLPIPPVADLVQTLLSDPVAQRSLAKTYNIPQLTTILPIATSCFEAADSGQWLSCFQELIESLFPKIITGLKNYAIDINDLRVIIDGVWNTGGDLPLMLGSTILNTGKSVGSSFSGFGDSSVNNEVSNIPSTQTQVKSLVSQTASLNSIQSAMISVGFFGVDFIADKIGIQDAEGLFENVIITSLPSEIGSEVQKSVDIFKLCQQLLKDKGRISSNLTFKDVPVGFVLYLLEAFHDAKWDVEQALSNMLLDDLSNGSTQFFTENIIKKADGSINVTTTLKGLVTKVLNDFPRLRFLLDGLAKKIGLSGIEDLLGTTNDVNESLNMSNGTSLATGTVLSSGATVQTARAIPGSNSNAGAGAGTKNTNSVPKKKSSLNWSAIAATTGTGALVGGPPGALLGAAAGLLFKGKQ